jgi:hypothetical protein
MTYCCCSNKVEVIRIEVGLPGGHEYSFAINATLITKSKAQRDNLGIAKSPRAVSIFELLNQSCQVFHNKINRGPPKICLLSRRHPAQHQRGGTAHSLPGDDIGFNPVADHQSLVFSGT